MPQSLDPVEQAVDSRTVPQNLISIPHDGAIDPIGRPLATALHEHGNEIFRIGEDEHVGLFGVAVLGQPFVGFAGNCGNGELPTEAKGRLPAPES